MEDLEILCRDCHNAHHRAEKAAKANSSGPNKRKKKRVRPDTLYRLLSQHQREILMERFGITYSGEFYSMIIGQSGQQIRRAAEQMLSIKSMNRVIRKNKGIPGRKARSKKNIEVRERTRAKSLEKALIKAVDNAITLARRYDG